MIEMNSWSRTGLPFKTIMIGAVFGLVLTGCMGANQADRNGTNGSGSTAGGTVNQTGLPIVNKPITIKMMVRKDVTDLTSWQDKEVIKKAEQETGIKLDITEVPSMAWDEKIGVVISSGDLPDVIVGGIPNLSLYTDSFQPLNGLIDKNAPVLVDLYKKHPELKFAATFPDGNIYSLPLLQTLGSKVGTSYSINKTWLDKLNLPVPQTTDQLYETLKAFKERDPNGNGKQDEIPYGFYENGSFGLDSMLWNFGLVNDAGSNVMVENGKVLFVPADPRYYEYLQYLHKLYAEGLIDPDGFLPIIPMTILLWAAQIPATISIYCR
jgi:ABC-type glycerol-3-phosphate transport system substrate-binding protein